MKVKECFRKGGTTDLELLLFVTFVSEFLGKTKLVIAF
jgi:hypothetical protein